MFPTKWRTSHISGSPVNQAAPRWTRHLSPPTCDNRYKKRRMRFHTPPPHKTQTCETNNTCTPCYVRHARKTYSTTTFHARICHQESESVVSTRAWATDEPVTAVPVPAGRAKSTPPSPPLAQKKKRIVTAKNALGYSSKSITGSTTLARTLDPHLLFRKKWAILIHSPRVGHFECVCTDGPHSSDYRKVFFFFVTKKRTSITRKSLQQGRSLYDMTASATLLHVNRLFFKRATSTTGTPCPTRGTLARLSKRVRRYSYPYHQSASSSPAK